jgi:hypothetical protein
MFKKKVLSAGIEEKYCRFTKKNIAVDENKIFGNEQKYCWFMKKIIMSNLIVFLNNES